MLDFLIDEERSRTESGNFIGIPSFRARLVQFPNTSESSSNAWANSSKTPSLVEEASTFCDTISFLTNS